MIAAAVARELQAERRRRRMTYAALAEATGIPPRTVRRILTAKVDPRVSQVVLLAWGLGLEPGELSRRVWPE